jgi:hypothetical protein
MPLCPDRCKRTSRYMAQTLRRSEGLTICIYSLYMYHCYIDVLNTILYTDVQDDQQHNFIQYLQINLILVWYDILKGQ